MQKTVPSNVSESAEVSRWYKKLVRSFLAKFGLGGPEQFDIECDRVLSIEKSISLQLPVCFLGQSGIGKSTLINALVAGKDMVLPAGGIGPLTAQALSVYYGESASFEAHYHPRYLLARLVFALEAIHRAELRKIGTEVPLPLPEELGLEVEGEIARETIESLPENPTEQQQKNQEYRKQALLLVAGQQEVERESLYLIDALNITIGKSPAWGSQLLPEDEQRVKGLQAALEYSKRKEPYRCANGDDEFRIHLRDHATGFLAPLIEELKVSWPSVLLASGVVLVDLPGIGISGDAHAAVTERFLREKAKALVLVVNTRGITRSDAELLRTSGFLSRFLHSADDPAADPVALLVAVVRVDDIADQRRVEDQTKSKRQHFSEVCAETIVQIRRQMREELEKVWDTSAGLSQTKREVLEGILENLEVHPLSAVQYRRFLMLDDDDPAFIKDESQSNVPRFSASLEALAKRHRAEQSRRINDARRVFFSSVNTHLLLIREQWVQETRAGEEAEKLRAELTEFLKPLRSEFDNRQGAYREFLKNTLPDQIKRLVIEARITASRDVYEYLDGLRDANWATLKAAVTRGGTFSGARHIDLPKDFAVRFEEPIAEIWGKSLLKEIRKRTKEYADDCVDFVEQTLGWAKERGAHAKTSLLEAQREAIKADAQSLTAVGKEIVDELRQDVKNKLLAKIEQPIRKSCERFVQNNQHIGIGVKRRIQVLFRDLAETSIESAISPSIELLINRFREVEQEIKSVLAQHADPLTQAAEAVVSSHEGTVKRSDAQKRARVLKELDEIFAGMPADPNLEREQHLVVL